MAQSDDCGDLADLTHFPSNFDHDKLAGCLNIIHHAQLYNVLRRPRLLPLQEWRDHHYKSIQRTRSMYFPTHLPALGQYLQALA